MLISIIIVVLLVAAYFNGARRGLVLTLLDLIGLVVLFILAANYSACREWLQRLVALFEGNGASWQATKGVTLSGSSTFYYGLAYWLIIIIGGLLIRRLIRSLNLVTRIPVIKQLNSLAGGSFGLVLSIFTDLCRTLGFTSMAKCCNQNKCARFTIGTSNFK
nr:CvpA family protein [Liquorilactobacillus satsumensis]